MAAFSVPRAQAAVLLLLLLASSMAADVAAKCDRTALDKETRGGTWQVYLLVEFDWVDYTIIAGCAAASFAPGVGLAVTGLCATGIMGTIEAKLKTYFLKQAVAPPTNTQLIDGLVAGGAELTTPDGLHNVRLGLVGFVCKACNCGSCIINWKPVFADCKRCKDWCTPEPNRVGVFVAVRKNPNGGGGTGGGTSGSRCITINNSCNKEYFAAVGLANNWNDGSTTWLRWWSQGWWKVPANTGSSPLRLCFNGITQFYLHFLNDAVTFNAEKSPWCIHSWNKFSILEMDDKVQTKYYTYMDSNTGVSAASCTGLGADYKEVTFYRFVYSSSAVTNFNININSCPSSASAANAGSSITDGPMRATATVRPTRGVAVLPNPHKAATTTAELEPAAALAAAAGPEVADDDMPPPAPEGGSSDLASKAAKAAATP